MTMSGLCFLWFTGLFALIHWARLLMKRTTRPDGTPAIPWFILIQNCLHHEVFKCIQWSPQALKYLLSIHINHIFRDIPSTSLLTPTPTAAEGPTRWSARVCACPTRSRVYDLSWVHMAWMMWRETLQELPIFHWQIHGFRWCSH